MTGSSCAFLQILFFQITLQGRARAGYGQFSHDCNSLWHFLAHQLLAHETDQLFVVGVCSGLVPKKASSSAVAISMAQR
jgi:hypothetical protein